MEHELADELQELLEGATEWPPPWERDVFDQVRLWAAFREADGSVLRPHSWGRDHALGKDRPYLVSPLPARIAGAKADMVFGEDPAFTAAAEQDQSNLDGLVGANRLPSRLQFAERVCASEGEVWWRGYTDPAANYPLVQFLSRAFVVPLFRGPTLLAVAFVAELDSASNETWRHVEIREQGYARNLLYKGASTGQNGLGDAESLDAHDDTAELEEEWNHGLPSLLCGRVVNDEGVDPTVGLSDYQPVEDLLYALNEATTIGVENARLTAKKRVVIPQRFLDQHGNFPGGAEVIVATEVDQDPDKPGQGLAMVEFEFDAEALIAWTNHLEDKTLAGTRTAPQLVGRHTEGAQTGPAFRARLLDSVLDAHGKGRYWDDELPNCLLDLQRIDALEEDAGGLANDWTRADEAPSVERQSILPEDDSEKATRLAQEVGALLKSRKTAIAEAHPDWDEDAVQAELDLINDENPLPEVPA